MGTRRERVGPLLKNPPHTSTAASAERGGTGEHGDQAELERECALSSKHWTCDCAVCLSLSLALSLTLSHTLTHTLTHIHQVGIRSDICSQKLSSSAPPSGRHAG